MIKDNIISEYVKDLSSTKSMPGGGAAAGLTLVQGVALILKVCNLTYGKAKYEEHMCLVKEVASKCEFLIKDIYDLIDEDVETFKQIENVFKMPNITDDEKSKRKSAMEKACIACLSAPKKMIEKAKVGIEIGKSIIGKSNASASSDVIVGIELMKAGAIGAYQNVEINRKSIKDTSVLKECDEILEILNEIKNM